MQKTLQALLDRQDCSRIAYLGKEEETIGFLRDYAKGLDLEFQELGLLDQRRWSFGGEYFEAIIIEDESFVADDKKIRSIKKALQKNRSLIFISTLEDHYSLREKLEPHGFSDFCTIEAEGSSLGYNVKINIMKKWFTFEQ